MRDPVDQACTQPHLAHRTDQNRQPLDPANIAGRRRPVVVRADGDVIFPRQLQHVLDVAFDRVQRHVGAFATIGPQKAGRKVQPGNPATVADRGQLPISQVAAGIADRMGVGMGGHQGRI